MSHTHVSTVSSLTGGCNTIKRPETGYTSNFQSPLAKDFLVALPITYCCCWERSHNLFPHPLRGSDQGRRDRCRYAAVLNQPQTYFCFHLKLTSSKNEIFKHSNANFSVQTNSNLKSAIFNLTAICCNHNFGTPWQLCALFAFTQNEHLKLRVLL